MATGKLLLERWQPLKLAVIAISFDFFPSIYSVQIFFTFLNNFLYIKWKLKYKMKNEKKICKLWYKISKFFLKLKTKYKLPAILSQTCFDDENILKKRKKRCYFIPPTKPTNFPLAHDLASFTMPYNEHFKVSLSTKKHTKTRSHLYLFYQIL